MIDTLEKLKQTARSNGYHGAWIPNTKISNIQFMLKYFLNRMECD